MRNKFFLGIVLASAMMLTSVASASLLFTGVHDFTQGYDPGGNDVVSSSGVNISDQSTSRFFDSFDFSSLGAATINSLVLTLEFDHAGPRGYRGWREAWTVRAQGSDSGSYNDDMFTVLFDNLSAQPIGYNPSTDISLGLSDIDVFAHSVATKSFTYWFSEFSSGADDFRLQTAMLSVFGDPAVVTEVPAPSSAALLGIGLFGAGVIARRRKNKNQLLTKKRPHSRLCTL